MCEFIGLRVFARDPANLQRNDAEVVCSERVPHEAAGFRHFVSDASAAQFWWLCVSCNTAAARSRFREYFCTVKRQLQKGLARHVGSLAQEQSEQM